MPRIIAYILFAGGIMVAVTGAAKMPAEGAEFPDTWPVFGGGMFVGAVGLVLWRWDIRSHKATARRESVDSGQNPLHFLRDMIAPARKLNEQIDTLDQATIESRIDELLESYLLPFAEQRQQVIDDLGMTRGAEISVAAAVGERLLNRAWSAAGDGHLPESRRSYHEAFAALEEAAQLASSADARLTQAG